jgi:hypothetical protein
MASRSDGRRRLSEALNADRPAEAAPQLDPFEKGIADALVRRGIVADVPGRETAADIEWAEYRARTRRVLDALRVPEPPAQPEPEPERPARLADQIRALIGTQTGDIPLNGQRLLDHAASQLDPGGSAVGGQSAGSSA